MQDKLLTEFERIGIKAVKENKYSELEKFLDKIAKGEEK
jgi:hypothetical protein